MTQDELWLKKYREVREFIETNHRNPSRHVPEERGRYCNWLKHNRKLPNAGLLKQKAEAMLKATGAFKNYEIAYEGLSMEDM